MSGGAGQVAGVVGPDAQRDQAAGGRRHDPELPAGVTGGEPAVGRRGQAEFLVVGGCRRDVRNADRD